MDYIKSAASSPAVSHPTLAEKLVIEITSQIPGEL